MNIRKPKTKRRPEFLGNWVLNHQTKCPHDGCLAAVIMGGNGKSAYAECQLCGKKLPASAEVVKQWRAY